MATVTVGVLMCEQTYSIVAGGIVTDVVTMGQTLDGPRYFVGTVTTHDCAITQSTSGESYKYIRACKQ